MAFELQLTFVSLAAPRIANMSLINQHFGANFFLVFMDEEIVVMVIRLSSGHMSRSVVEASLAG